MTILPNHRFPKTRRAVFVALFVVLSALSANGQRRERTVESWKPLHYDVNLVFNEQLTEISSARTEVSLEVLKPNVTKIDLDFGEMPVDSILIAGAPAQFDRTSEQLNVTLPRTANRGDKFSIAISYHGHPRDGLIFAKDRDGKQSATGDNWPNRVHHWIPTLDHPSAKATVSFTISAPQRYQVLANGKFVTPKGNASTSNWKFEEAKPIPPYCMIVTVNEGAIIDSPDKTITNLIYNVPQRDREHAAKGFSSAAPALAFFNQTIAPYPYEKLALIVAETRFGGMENSSAIVFANNLLEARGNEKMSARFGIPTRIEDVVAHEIAHQWFGDSVTESTWADLWLSEGFATYFAGLFIEKYEGNEAFHEYMRVAAERYFRFSRSNHVPIHDTTTQDLMSLLNANNYQKGAWVLHMLRRQLGDEAFFKGLRNYYNDHASGNATTEDLRSALEKSSGKDLKQFFARWIYGAGHPRYDLSLGPTERRAASSLVVRLNQLQDGEPFLDPVPVEFTVNGKTERRTIYPKGKLTTTTIELPGNPTAVKIDPDETLLKEVVSSIKPGIN
jgi:aminopeptidase N